jgi:hypothetical protein
MCNPVVAVALTAASTAVSMSQQAASQRMQGQLHERQAQLERMKGSYAAQRATERGRQLIGRQIAGYSSAGIAANTGTPLETIDQTAQDIDLDVQAIRFGSDIAASNEALLGRINRANSRATMAAMPLAVASAGVNQYVSLSGPYGSP